MVIREGTEEDLVKLRDSLPDGFEAARREAGRIEEKGIDVFAVAEIDGLPVAFLTAERKGNTCTVEHIYVGSDFSFEKVAGEFLDFLECGKMVLAGGNKNLPVPEERGIFERLGFENEGPGSDVLVKYKGSEKMVIREKHQSDVNDILAAVKDAANAHIDDKELIDGFYRGRGLTAFQGDRIAGFLIYDVSGPYLAEIIAFWVAEEQKARGAEEDMFKRAEEEWAELGFEKAIFKMPRGGKKNLLFEESRKLLESCGMECSASTGEETILEKVIVR